MSHTLRKINLGNSALCESTIVDYVQGGEAYTLAELGITGPVTGVVFIPTYPVTVSLTPVLSGGKVVLLADPTNPLMEQPSTVGLNYAFVAIVHGQ